MKRKTDLPPPVLRIKSIIGLKCEGSYYLFPKVQRRTQSMIFVIVSACFTFEVQTNPNPCSSYRTIFLGAVDSVVGRLLDEEEES